MIWGTALMGAGTALLLERLGRLPEWANRFQWWGGIVIFIGLATILCAKRAESVGSGVTIALLGGWFLLVTNHQFGLGWYNSWPLALVAAGAGTVGHAIAANWLPDTARARLRKRAGLDENAEESHA
jgi:hypothetical protein